MESNKLNQKKTKTPFQKKLRNFKELPKSPTIVKAY
jgi:hypothetical protein